MMVIFYAIWLICASSIIFIVAFILVKGLNPFIAYYGDVPNASFLRFISSTTWTTNNYGVLGIAINTLYLTFLAALVATPISVLTALFIVRIAPKQQLIVELLAAVPSIVFGLFGMGVINPMVKGLAALFGVQTAGGISGLSTVIVLIIMMLPTITMLSITSMRAVKPNQIHASLALGLPRHRPILKSLSAGQNPVFLWH